MSSFQSALSVELVRNLPDLEERAEGRGARPQGKWVSRNFQETPAICTLKPKIANDYGNKAYPVGHLGEVY